VAVSCFGFDFFSTQGISWALAQAGGMIYTPAFLDGFGFGSYNGSLWTIPIELQFYVLLPALYLLGGGGLRTTRLAAAGFAVFFVVAVLHRTYVPSASGPEPELMIFKLLRYSFIPHVYLFFAGVLMQRLKIHESLIFRGKGLHWLAAYLLLVGIAPQAPLVEIVKLLMLGVVAVSLAFTAPGTSLKILGRTDISYGVYIYHGLLINIFVQSGLVGQWSYAAWLFLLTGLAGYLSWTLVEKPCLLHKQRGRSAIGTAHRDRPQPAHMTTT
jgi:peptidoglycan/LPS O-acetylase OafA/YrhL